MAEEGHPVSMATCRCGIRITSHEGTPTRWVHLPNDCPGGPSFEAQVGHTPQPRKTT